MFTSHSSRRLVVANCLGLFMVLSVQDMSLAASPQRVAAKAADSTALAGSQAATSQTSDHPTLRLAWFDGAELPETVTEKMKLRVERIFEQIGVPIEWHEPASVSNGNEAAEPYYLKVILFDKEPGAMGHPADAMGVCIGTHFPPDAVWLFDPTILRNLTGRKKPRPLSPDELGRAYAKVLAHEVIHAVANDQRHADSGLMAPNQNRHTLVSRAVEIDEGSAAAFHSGLQRIHEIVDERR